MSKLRVQSFGLSIDGYGAGLHQSLENPLGVLGPEGKILEFVTTGVTAEEREHIGHLPIGKGILGLLITEARPMRLPDISADTRSVGFPPNHPPMHSFLGAPVKAGGKVFGNIYLTEKQGAPEFTEEDEQALVVLASQAGITVENARLYEEAQQHRARLEAVREITAWRASSDCVQPR